jgi:adenylate kinase
MKASDAFKAIPLTPEQEESEEADDIRKKNEFQWHTQKGIIKKVDVLNAEFNLFRGLNPVKILITGPPASGKTFYTDLLAKYYNIPKVNVAMLLNEVWRFTKMDEEAIGEGDDFIREVREKVEELRDKEIERMQEEYDAQKKESDEDFDPESINRETLKIRIPEDILYKLLKTHLNHNDCRNRGYILDGYPRSFKDAQHCFLRTPDMPEGEEFEEEELEEGQEKTFKGYIVDTKIIP